MKPRRLGRSGIEASPMGLEVSPSAVSSADRLRQRPVGDRPVEAVLRWLGTGR